MTDLKQTEILVVTPGTTVATPVGITGPTLAIKTYYQLTMCLPPYHEALPPLSANRSLHDAGGHHPNIEQAPRTRMAWLVHLPHVELLAGRFLRRLPLWPSPWPSEARPAYPGRVLSGTHGEHLPRPCRKFRPVRNELMQIGRQNEVADAQSPFRYHRRGCRVLRKPARPAIKMFLTIGVANHFETAVS